MNAQEDVDKSIFITSEEFAKVVALRNDHDALQIAYSDTQGDLTNAREAVDFLKRQLLDERRSAALASMKYFPCSLIVLQDVLRKLG